MTKFLTTKAHGFILAFATIQQGSHPVLSLSLHIHSTHILNRVTQKQQNMKQRAFTVPLPSLNFGDQ